MTEDTKSLSELYDDALAEGGLLTVYAGGDIPTQQDSVVAAFAADFPKIDFRMIVDYSKFHDARIDRQLERGELIADVAQLQTSFDFPYWKERGVLLNYQPVGFSSVYDGFKDPDGAWVAVTVYAFSLLRKAGSSGPNTAEELAEPEWRNRVVASHPGDDDATLFLFQQYVQQYGWQWLEAFAANEVKFRRGTNSPGDAVADGGADVGLGGAWGGQPDVEWVLPPAGHPFLAWGQRAAIFKSAPHPAAAKLYMNWMLSSHVQSSMSFRGWSVRDDIVPKGGSIWTVSDAGTDAFAEFMSDRAAVERWRQTMNLFLGEVSGEPSPGRLGLSPSHHA